ncbi:phospholipase A2-like [Hydractinia symbiolongicarpus]|uniref:phospholipase A2-like n=1 Tax=Hydractinia symbiolongicarpus TaxID=13093 RepID=UPI00254FD576|nr:phospholipase A2-like [Hydractinia symbiolongicarpus]
MGSLYILLSLVVVFNLTNGASLSARQKALKQKDMIADTREFPEMEFSEQEKEVIRMLKNQNLLNSLLDGDDQNMTADVRKLGWKIFPGTHWCGNGNIADSQDDSDLGTFDKVDRCCRTHDHCPRNLNGGTSGYGTVNTGKYTASDCECDAEFKSCLKAVPKGKWYQIGTRLQYGSARLIGRMFFDWLKMKCLDFEGPSAVNGEASDSEKAVLKDPKPFYSKKK